MREIAAIPPHKKAKKSGWFLGAARELWKHAPNHVTLKRVSEPLGEFSYDDILSKLKAESEQLIARNATVDVN